MADKTDNETQKILSENEELRLLSKGRGWAIIRQRLIDKIIFLSDILELNESDITKLSFRLAVNKEVITILLQWLREVEGAKNDLNVQQMLNEEKRETYIKIIN